MREVRCAQYTPEWWDARRGLPTASKFDKIVTSTGEPSKQRLGYLYQCAAARISGVYEDTYTSLAMQRGIELEEEARRVYAMEREVAVDEVGFCLADGERWGASPDGLIGEDGVLEIKCPEGRAAVEYLLKGKLPTAYIQQCQGQLLVTERQFCDFVSYYPGLPMLIVRTEPDTAFLCKLKAALVEFCDKLDSICAKIKGGS